ncbi:O-methyltransferase [Psychroserpens mesophilus]|uniref:O-methyltransferase n=1 Tax=Psychroserpens mesophilus TaxID=325473 RepID=UPI003D64C6B1
MFQIIEYIKFLLRSTNQHGVHSPFVYDFVTKCFYDDTKYDVYSSLSEYRKSLLNTKKQIEISDFGAGSRVFNSNLRAINVMAKNSGSTLKRTKLLFRIVQYFKPQHTLELGTSLGIATQALALGYSENHVTTIEGCKNISDFTTQQFNRFNINNIHLINKKFDKALSELQNNNYDLVFFDGNHNREATLEYFNMLIDKAHNDSIFIFDDIYWSKEMAEAWQIIKTHSKVTVSIDTFFWGMIFFRKEQAKENFTIRL